MNEELLQNETPETEKTADAAETTEADKAVEAAPQADEIAEATPQADETAKAAPQADEAAAAAQTDDAPETTESMADYEDQFDNVNPWNIVSDYMNKGTVLSVKVDGVVNGGVIAHVEGLRGFIPASKLSLSYIEDLEIYLLQDVDVKVIDVDQANNRLVLSAREILKDRRRQEQAERIANVPVGSVLEGTVESLQSYGAFIRLENDLSGLVHVSQISLNRIKAPADVLKINDPVKVKVIGIKDGKISLSIKALLKKGGTDDYTPVKVDIPKAENIGTSLGDLFKDLKL